MSNADRMLIEPQDLRSRINEIDEEVRDLILALNDNGYITGFCCQGERSRLNRGSHSMIAYIAFAESLPGEIIKRLGEEGLSYPYAQRPYVVHASKNWRTCSRGKRIKDNCSFNERICRAFRLESLLTDEQRDKLPIEEFDDSLLVQTRDWINSKNGECCLSERQLAQLGVSTEGMTPHVRTSTASWFKVSDFAWGAELLNMSEIRYMVDLNKRKEAEQQAATQAVAEQGKARAEEHGQSEFPKMEFYTTSDLRKISWSKLAEERFLDQSLFDKIPCGYGWDYVYPGDYIRAVNLRKKGNRLTVDNVPAPAQVKRTSWLMQRDVLNRGWKRKQIAELPEPIHTYHGRGETHWYRLDVVEAIEEKRQG